MTLLIAVHFGLAIFVPLLTRWLRCRAFFVLALAPAVTFGWLVFQAPAILAGRTLTETIRWIPALGIDLSFRIGTLQWVLGLVVSGVGALVLFYCRWYFAGGETPARTAGLLTGFAGVMFGLVTADDLIVLYVFWELTTVFSYLLIGHNPTRRANRRAALTALMVTTFGGLAMLIGVIILGVDAGTFRLSTILASPGQGAAITIAVLLLLVGALSKSALVPFHFWLPGAMAAPTPVSAYLHAAAMVKAGIYLIALLAPVFAGVPGWRPIIMTLGAATMIVGAWRALRQYDIKVLLAYGTVSQLGFMSVLTGLGTRSAELAGIAMIISHALFKACLFLTVGIVDHNAGTRDLRRLSGVGRQLPVIAIAATLACASMAAVPPLIGFTAKEAAFESLTYLVRAGDGTAIPAAPAVLLLLTLVVGSGLTVAYTLRFLWGAFADKPNAEQQTTCHRVPIGFGLAPVLLAAFSLIGGFVGPQVTAALQPYVEQVPTGHESHGLALWHGLTTPLAMSAVAMIIGIVMFWQRDWISRVQHTFPKTTDTEEIYQLVMRGVDRLAVEVTAVTQRGSLPIYLGLILLVVVVLPGGTLMVLANWPTEARLWDSPAQFAVAGIIVVAALLAATSRGRLKAIILVGVTGYGTAVLFLLHGAPDLALTQILVETVSLVVFVLVLRKLPKYFTNRPLHSSRWWRLIIAVLVGSVVSAIAFVASGTRTAEPISKAFAKAAYEFGYGKNIVNVTLVDIRAWDTMGELSVLVVAATGVASLIFLRARYTDIAAPQHSHRVRGEMSRSEVTPGGRMTWLRGGEALSPVKRSIIFEVVTRLLFPVMILCSLFYLFTGHNAPGGGFAGGLIAGLALTIRYLAGGRYELDEAAPVDAGRVLGLGLLIAGVSALAPVAFGGKVLESYAIDFHLPLLGDLHLVTSLFFDIGVYFVVIGVMLDLARSLGSGIDLHEEENRAPGPKTPAEGWTVSLGREAR